ncbi:hypothetical protein PVAP13_5KG395800 [Panicum virgatum]|uniref:Uncharacterized protein n=1 Tax=Panicum virgatum TaxID=38727 RepID=A0A8T0SKV7_PANVG|nr:hypothetical protein PVAP13_5KG395800 [Panicum virgatum]
MKPILTTIRSCSDAPSIHSSSFPCVRFRNTTIRIATKTASKKKLLLRPRSFSSAAGLTGFVFINYYPRKAERGTQTNPKRGKSAMAAAVLRYAVKRLGSRALQRPKRSYTAAADNIPGAGGRTVWPTSSSRSSTCNGAQKSSTKQNKKYLASIQQKEIESKTEELFHLIAKMDRELPSHCSRDNRQLLMHLSILVQHKPDDPQWRFYRRAVTVNKYAFYGLVLSISYMSVSDELSQIYDALVE